MEKWKKRSVDLLLGLAINNKADPSVIPYIPQKTHVSHREMPYFKRSSPERHGIPSRHITEMLHALEADMRVNLHNLIVLKGGEVIAECSAPGYDIHTAHLSHSMSKTVTGMAIGMLIDDGKLTLGTHLVDLFPELPYRDKRFPEITVEDILEMSTGIHFSEAGSVTEDEWTPAYFASAIAFTPGGDFAYNSMNSYILAKIVHRVSGKSLMEFLDERLFSVLGIHNVHWEIGPEGIEKGGWGLFLSCESWAKLGYMMLRGGEFEGHQILSPEWVHLSTTTHCVTPESAGDFNYGFQLWVSRVGHEFLFNGMLGQNVWVYPEKDIVVAMNAGNNELFQQSPSLGIVRHFLSGIQNAPQAFPDLSDLNELRETEQTFFFERHWIRPKRKKTGLPIFLHLKPADPYIPAWDLILGTYCFRKNNYSILPLIIRAMQNNYLGGIEQFSFYNEGKHLYFTSREGGVDYTLEVGLYEYKESILDFRGERYIVKAMGVAIRDEDLKPLFKLELLFPEMPNTRIFKFSFLDDEKLLVRMDELPNQRIAEAFISSLPVTSPKLEFLSQLLNRRLGEQFLDKKLHELFAPVLVGAKRSSPNFGKILSEEESKKNAELEKTAFLSELLTKYTKNQSTDDRSEGIFKRIFSRFLKKKDTKASLPAPIPYAPINECAECEAVTNLCEELVDAVEEGTLPLNVVLEEIEESME